MIPILDGGDKGERRRALSKKAVEIIDIKAAPDWNELKYALGMGVRLTVFDITEEQKSARLAFFVNHVDNNTGLTDAGKTYLKNIMDTSHNPWHQADLVVSVSQEGNKITVKTDNATFHYYIDSGL